MIVGLNGKRVVILGGTSGIGLATAKAAQGQRAAVVVASSRSQRVESTLAVLQGKAEGEVVDLADE
jgi:NAD(P)-dependent dehydrogenase (short-subunit alcohol dehydrogenase family)